MQRATERPATLALTADAIASGSEAALVEFLAYLAFCCASCNEGGDERNGRFLDAILHLPEEAQATIMSEFEALMPAEAEEQAEGDAGGDAPSAAGAASSAAEVATGIAGNSLASPGPRPRKLGFSSDASSPRSADKRDGSSSSSGSNSRLLFSARKGRPSTAAATAAAAHGMMSPAQLRALGSPIGRFAAACAERADRAPRLAAATAAAAIEDSAAVAGLRESTRALEEELVRWQLHGWLLRRRR